MIPSKNLLPTFIALGSNLGDSQQILSSALYRLESISAGSFLASSIIVTSPVDCPPGSPNYHNCAARLEMPEALDPLLWMQRLLEIELEFGPRPRNVVNEARYLDLDWIGFGDRIISHPPELVLPHPRAQEREFVLIPLNEIAPDWRFPDSGKTPSELLRALKIS